MASGPALALAYWNEPYPALLVEGLPQALGVTQILAVLQPTTAQKRQASISSPMVTYTGPGSHPKGPPTPVV